MKQTVCASDLVGGSSSLQQLEGALKAIEATPAGRELVGAIRILIEIADRYSIPQRPVLTNLVEAVRILESRKQKPTPSVEEIAKKQFALTEKALWNLIGRLISEVSDAGDKTGVPALQRDFMELSPVDGPLELNISALFAAPPQAAAGVVWPPPIDSPMWKTESEIVVGVQATLKHKSPDVSRSRLLLALDTMVSSGFLSRQYHLKKTEFVYIALKQDHHCQVPRTGFERQARRLRMARVVPHVEPGHGSQVVLELTPAAAAWMHDVARCGELRAQLGLVVPFANQLTAAEGAPEVKEHTYAAVFGFWDWEAGGPSDWHGAMIASLLKWNDPKVSMGAYGMRLDDDLIAEFREKGDADAWKSLHTLFTTAEQMGTGERKKYVFSFGHGPFDRRVAPVALATSCAPVAKATAQAEAISAPPSNASKRPKKRALKGVAAVILGSLLLLGHRPGVVTHPNPSGPGRSLPLQAAAKGDSFLTGGREGRDLCCRAPAGSFTGREVAAKGDSFRLTDERERVVA